MNIASTSEAASPATVAGNMSRSRAKYVTSFRHFARHGSLNTGVECSLSNAY